MPGYHLNGTVTSSASWSRARSSSTSVSAMISAPPRTKGTCGAQTAILMNAASARPRARDARLEVVDQPQRGRVEGALVVRERLDVPAHQLAQHRLRRRRRARRGRPGGAAGCGRPTPARAARPPRGRRCGRRAPPASPGAAPERRTSCFSCSKSAVRSVSVSEEIPARSPFSGWPSGIGGLYREGGIRSLRCGSGSASSRSSPARSAAPRHPRAGSARGLAEVGTLDYVALHTARRARSGRGTAGDCRAGVPATRAASGSACSR